MVEIGQAKRERSIPPAEAEFALVEPYLGVFERIFIAYQARQVDAETLDQLYGYRLSNIWAKQRIVDDKLRNNALKRYWKRLIALTHVLEAHKEAASLCTPTNTFQ